MLLIELFDVELRVGDGVSLSNEVQDSYWYYKFLDHEFDLFFPVSLQ